MYLWFGLRSSTHALLVVAHWAWELGEGDGGVCHDNSENQIKSIQEVSKITMFPTAGLVQALVLGH